MLKNLSVQGFKSLRDTGPIELAPLTVFFGPNAVGKSNLLDSVVLLSRLATARTAAEALKGIRGQPLELFSFPAEGGLPLLLEQQEARCRLRTILETGPGQLDYAVELGISPASGQVAIHDETLIRLSSKGRAIGNPLISKADASLRIRRRTKPAHPWQEELPLNHTCLSNRRYSGREYAPIEQARELLASVRTYYLDPRTAMRQAQPPQEVDDIGPRGEHLGPFLYRLQAKKPKAFAAVERTLRSLIPSVDALHVELDMQQGMVNVEVRQDGTPFSVRILSEGTLRVLALVCVAVNPWSGPVIAFEEPENGVHPRRIELIAQILGSLALRDQAPRQVLLTSHSPLFCRAIYTMSRQRPERVSLFHAVREGTDTRFHRLDASPLFHDQEIRAALRSARGEDVVDEDVLEALIVRGLLDA
ncbi:MAG: AAA family ATPase [Acidobacteriota bacterium]